MLSKPKPIGADNFETMPDDVPQTIKADATPATIQSILEKVPVGTAILAAKMGAAGVYGKKADGWYNIETGNKLPANPVHVIEGASASIIPPGVEVPEFIPPSYEPKVDWKQTAEMVAKAEKAKALGEWAKKHKPVDNADALRALSYLQKAAPAGMQFWVRQAPGEDKYVIGSDDPGFNEFWKSLGIESVTTKTPLGSFQKFVLDDLVTHTPGAGSMKGPDGHTYPVGTTFQEIQKPTTVRDRIEQQEGFYKWSDHKDDPSLVVMKVKGTGEEQIDKAKLIALTMGLTVPEPKVGGQNVLTFFKKADLDKVLFTDTEYVPTIPAQPPTFIAKALPGFGGSGQDGLPATNNRSDLAVLDMIKPPASGHWIRCGRHGVFWNDQIQVRRVRDTDGKMHWEVMGQVVNGQDLSPAMPSGSLHFQKADGQKFDHYSYDQLSYDSATGIITEKPGNIGTYGGYVGQTANGAVVEIATTTSYPSITGVFRVRIPDGLNVETELADAFTKMGLDAGDAMADPTDQDTNMLIKQQVARAVLGPAGYKKVMIGKVTEADLDEMCALIETSLAQALDQAGRQRRVPGAGA